MKGREICQIFFLLFFLFGQLFLGVDFFPPLLIIVVVSDSKKFFKSSDAKINKNNLTSSSNNDLHKKFPTYFRN